MTVLAITGGRTFSDAAFVYRALDWALERVEFTLLIHGDAPGVDTLGKEWAEARDIPQRAFPAAWDDLEGVSPLHIRTRPDGTRYNVRAGFERNERMVNFPRLTHGLIFPGGRGTMDMAGRLKARLGGQFVHDLRGSYLR